MGENPENSNLKVDLYTPPKIEYFHRNARSLFTHNDPWERPHLNPAWASWANLRIIENVKHE